MSSPAPGTGQPHPDSPRCRLSVFFFADEVNLGGPDIGVASEFADLVHAGPVADGVVDRRFAQAVDADAPAAQPVRVDAGGAGRPREELAVRPSVASSSPAPRGPHRPILL
jgi:hypothetical protein